MRTFLRECETAEGKRLIVPHHSLFDIIKRILEYPGNYSKMQFMAFVGSSMSEFWHGRVWRQSPLFAEHLICNTVTGSTYRLGQWVVALVNGVEVSGKLVSSFRASDNPDVQCCGVMPLVHHHGQMYLDWEGTVTVTANCIVRSAEIGSGDVMGAVLHRGDGVEVVGFDALPDLLCDLVPPEQFAQWAEQDAIGDHELTLKLFLVYFFDDFAAYSKVNRKVGGGYITFGNLIRCLRSLLRNIWDVHLCPPGIDPVDAAAPLREEIALLQTGTVVLSVELNGITRRVRLIGGLGVACLDTPQGTTHIPYILYHIHTYHEYYAMMTLRTASARP
jgi:hypothetical protein